MPKEVDTLIRKVSRNIKPRKGDKKSAAIATLISRGVIKKKGKHLAKA